MLIQEALSLKKEAGHRPWHLGVYVLWPVQTERVPHVEVGHQWRGLRVTESPCPAARGTTETMALVSWGVGPVEIIAALEF